MPSFRLFPSYIVVACFPYLANCNDLSLLVANSQSDSVVRIDLGDEQFKVLDFSALTKPDNLRVIDDKLFVSAGENVDDSGIYIIDDDGPSVFASGGGLKQPYGFGVYNGILYVSSFMTDQILMYDAFTGEYISEFANKSDELCNGPNGLSIHEGILYLATEGSNVVDGVLSYLYPSQIVAYELSTGIGTVFSSPEPIDDGLGFVSMLASVVHCGDDGECMLLTSDFGGGLRAFSLDGTQRYAVGTTYKPGASTGSLSIDPDAKEVYVTGFLTATSPGVIMRFDLLTGDPMPSKGRNGAVFLKNERLIRPIGIVVLSTSILEDDDKSRSTSSDSSE